MNTPLLNDQIVIWANKFREVSREGDPIEEGKLMLQGQDLIDQLAPGQTIESVQDYENPDDSLGDGVHIELMSGFILYIPL